MSQGTIMATKNKTKPKPPAGKKPAPPPGKVKSKSQAPRKPAVPVRKPQRAAPAPVKPKTPQRKPQPAAVKAKKPVRTVQPSRPKLATPPRRATEPKREPAPPVRKPPAAAVKKPKPKPVIAAPKKPSVAETRKQLPKPVAAQKKASPGWERYRVRDAKHFRRLIMERREKILRELGLLTESTRNTVSEYSGDHSTYSLHMADQGTDAQEREKAFLLASREGRYLKYLDRALVMLDEGSYGYCSDCSKPIQKRRLELVPTARLCIECKLKEEQRRPR